MPRNATGDAMRARALGQRIVSLLALLGVSVLVTGLAALAAGEQHDVVLKTDSNFEWRVIGYIEYTHDNPWGNSATIQTSSGSITVKPGDRVKIVVDAVNQGKIWFGTDNWMQLDNLPVKAIYVNGELVASGTMIIWTNMYYDLQSLVSTLKIKATLKQGKEYGWAQLTIDGDDYISRWDYDGYFIVYNIAPSQSKDLNLDIESQYFEGVGKGIEWVNESGNVRVIGVDELPFLRFFLDWK